MQGLHLTADLYHCQCAAHWLTDAAALLQACESAAMAAGLTTVGRLGHTFEGTAGGPGGVTATVLLAESHLCVHTWPELGSVTLDVYVCNFSADHSQRARGLMTSLLGLFQPTEAHQHALQRGQHTPEHMPLPTHPTPLSTSGTNPLTTLDAAAVGHAIDPRSTSAAHAPHAAPALILAAGRGERMRPLTDTCPKPLLPVRGQPLLAWHVQALLQGGCRHLVFNTAWLGSQISSFFDPYRLPGVRKQLCNYENMGKEFSSVSLAFSDEQADFGCALETAGGIARALALLFPAHGPATRPLESAQPIPRAGTAGSGSVSASLDQDQVFWVVAGDVFVPGFVFAEASVARFRASTALAHLWLVPNPAHNPRGDFGLTADGLALNLPATATDTPMAIHAHTTAPRYTYSTIGLYRAELFTAPWCDIPPGNPTGVKAPLAPLLRRAMDAGRVSAEVYTGEWTDVGTPERLAALNASVA